PIRPGETRFQITYRLPYSGSLKLGPKPTMATDTIAIMMPKSMSFQAGTGAGYTPVTEETTAQTYVARNVSPSQPLEFTVSGAGQLPRDSAAPTAGDGGQAGPQQAAGGSAATDTRPGGGLGNPIDPEGTNDPWAKYKWWILGGLGLAMAAGAGVMLKNGPKNAAAAANLQPIAAPVSTGSGDLFSTLKEELFALETDRLGGRLGEAEYAEQKAALEVVLKRALSRREPGPVASKPTEVSPLRG
ncbi:MAG TPA: carboxypeptidase regulatory-like domain-containing protein, partial [Edaphobacter sp.]